ncbi:MAG: ribulose-phosphate 3-epimerase [Rickettsiaceae bacterium]|nr:ribulose-phosphate 3-epimerase [Rickettsiaceae bacterium]
MLGNIKISPSILSADFGNLESEIKKICSSQSDFIHIDVMDGNFVPNLTIGPDVIKQIRKHSELKFDVHLMIQNPDLYYLDYIESGADILTFHVEASKDPAGLIDKIHQKGSLAGISIKPNTEIGEILPYLEKLDLILIMSVEPGFGGQKFLDSILEKVSEISKLVANLPRKPIISVDGGINKETGAKAIKAGANMLVSGTYLFNSDNFSKAVLDLKNSLC